MGQAHAHLGGWLVPRVWVVRGPASLHLLRAAVPAGWQRQQEGQRGWQRVHGNGAPCRAAGTMPP